MVKLNRLTLESVHSLVLQAKERAIRDIILDIRDGKKWTSDKIPQGIALVIEKWLGFWYAFLAALAVGWLGLALVEAARWASDILIPIDTASWLVTRIGTFGFLLLLLSGIGLFAVVVVSVVRGLLWLRGMLKKYWTEHTPRHTNSDAESETPQWPPSEDEMDTARAKLRKFALRGSLLFMAITSTFLWLELNYPNQLHAIVSDPALSSAGDAVNAAIWVINIEGLFGAVAPGVSQAWVVYSIFVFVLPGIFIAIAVRNLLFTSEAYVRSQIERVAEGSILSWTGFKLTGLFFAFSLWTVAILYQVLPGL